MPSHPFRRLTHLLISIGLVLAGLLPAAATPPARPVAATAGRSGGNGIYAYADDGEAGGPAFAWNSVVGLPGSGRLATTDSSAANAVAPFPIAFYGVASPNLRVGNNGAILFNDAGSTTIGDTNSDLTGAAANNIIAPFWDDLGTAGAPAGVYTATVGAAPNRQFVIQWEQMPIFGVANSAVSFQAVFSEGSGDILFFYNDASAGNAAYDNGASATVGIRGSGAAQALQYSFNTASLASGRAIRFRRLPPNVSLSPAAQYAQAQPGASVAATLTLGNGTGANDVFDITYAAGAGNFPISGPATVSAADLASAPINVSVAVPAGASAGAEDIGTVTAAARSNPALTASATVRTQVVATTACANTPAAISGGSNAVSVAVPITVANTLTPGRVTFRAAFSSAPTPADFRMELIDPVGTTVALHNQTTAAMSGTYDLTRGVDGPGALADFDGTLGNGVWTLRLSRRAGSPGSITLSGCALNLVPAAEGVYLAPARQSKLVPPGQPASYTLSVINNTAAPAGVGLGYAGSGFAVSGPAAVTVPALGSQEVTVAVQTEPSAPYLSSDTLTVTAAAGAFSDSATLKTTLAAAAWELLAPMQIQRTSLAAAALSDGKIYAIGGQSGGTAALATVEVYDPAANSWSNGPALPGPRRDIRAAVLNNKIYVPGGYTGSATSNLMYVFDNGGWSQVNNTLPVAVNRPVVVSDPATNRILVFGGDSGFSRTAATQIYSATSGLWSSGAAIPIPGSTAFATPAMSRAAGARIGRKVYLAGGVNDAGSPQTGMFIYDLDANSWSAGPAMPGPQVEAGGVALGSRFCVIGGSSGVTSPEVALTTCFDTATNTWGGLPGLNAARLQLASVVGYNGGVYAIGGNDAVTPYAPSCPTIGGNYQHCATAERYAFSATTPARFAGSSKTVTPASVVAGGLLTYTLAVANGGQQIGTAYLTDTLSPNVTLESASAGLSFNAGVLTGGPISVPANGSVSYEVVVRVKSTFSGSLGNSFQLSGDGTLRMISAPAVTVIGQLSAGFTSSGPATLGQATTFTANASGGTGPYAYAWDFGDGASVAGPAAIRTHAYAAAGAYTVVLTVTDSASLTAVTTDMIVISAAPTASFVSSGPDTLGQTTAFTATASGAGPLSYAWDFGDGATGTGQNPSHAYAAAGTYSVTLTVTDSNAASAVAAGTVVIGAAPADRFTVFVPLIVR
ncbi:MAG TPA: PKD domain-containing protein [Herpetosiphonaceae bacterium]|nr:PKD domain-containing protein [Herpetosiphonaceae bacterium]